MLFFCVSQYWLMSLSLIRNFTNFTSFPQSNPDMTYLPQLVKTSTIPTLPYHNIALPQLWPTPTLPSPNSALSQLYIAITLSYHFFTLPPLNPAPTPPYSNSALLQLYIATTLPARTLHCPNSILPQLYPAPPLSWPNSPLPKLYPPPARATVMPFSISGEGCSCLNSY